MIETYEHNHEEEQRKIQENLNKPVKMLEDLKSKWNEMFYQQTHQMKDMIQNSVNDALVKRKEERKNRKNKEKEGSLSDGGSKDSRL